MFYHWANMIRPIYFHHSDEIIFWISSRIMGTSYLIRPNVKSLVLSRVLIYWSWDIGMFYLRWSRGIYWANSNIHDISPSFLKCFSTYIFNRMKPNISSLGLIYISWFDSWCNPHSRVEKSESACAQPWNLIVLKFFSASYFLLKTLSFFNFSKF